MNAATLVSIHEPADVTRINAVFISDGALSHRAFHGNDFLHFLIGELCKMVRVATRPFAAPLSYHVGCVVFRCANKQVVRSDAEWVVAGVAYKSARPRHQSCQISGKNMRTDGSSANPESAIPAWTKSSSSPNPTTIGSLDVVPKPIFVGHTNRSSLRPDACRALVMHIAKTASLCFSIAGFISAFHVGNVKALQRSYQ